MFLKQEYVKALVTPSHDSIEYFNTVSEYLSDYDDVNGQRYWKQYSMILLFPGIILSH